MQGQDAGNIRSVSERLQQMSHALSQQAYATNSNGANGYANGTNGYHQNTTNGYAAGGEEVAGSEDVIEGEFEAV